MGIFRKEEKKVRETIELYADSISEKDMDLLMSIIALDEDFLAINQNPYEKVVGAKKFYVRMKALFKSADNIDISINWMFLSVIDNAAWVNSEMRFGLQKGARRTDENRSVTFVLEKRRGDWFIVHIINSVESIAEESIDTEPEVSEETEVYDFDARSTAAAVSEPGEAPEETDPEKR